MNGIRRLIHWGWQGIRSLSITLLVFEFIFPSALFAQPQIAEKVADHLGHRAWFSDPLLELVEPFDIQRAPKLSGSDPVVDRDPYFLRSQRWETASLPAPQSSSPGDHEVIYRAVPGGLELSVVGVAGTLHLHRSLIPIAALPDYLLLAATDGSIFAERGGYQGEAPGQGLFAISWDDFTSASVAERRVPIFFLPLPGEGWVGAVRAAQVPDQELVLVRAVTDAGDMPHQRAVTDAGDMPHQRAVTDAGDLPLEYADIETLVKVGRSNLILAYALAAKTAGPQQAFLPPTLSTAGFGIIFTGLHGEKPSASLWQTASLYRQRSALGSLAPLLARLFHTSSALADPWMTFEEVITVLFPKLAYVGSIISLCMVAAIGLKHTLYRSRYLPGEQRYSQWLQPRQRQGEAWKNNITVYGHLVTVLAALPFVGTGNPLQFWFNRLLPSLSAGKNSLVRKLFHFFVGFATETNRDLQINDKVVKAALVTTTVDIFCVAYQLYGVVPAQLQQLAAIDPSWKARVDHILDRDNATTASFALEETGFVAMNHLTHEPSAYASDVKAQSEQRAAYEVDEEMRGDPHGPGWEKERQRRIEARIAEKYAEAGLGSKDTKARDEFLFDAQTIYSAMSAMLGYAPAEAWSRPQRLREAAGEQLPGLVIPSIWRAWKDAEAKLAAYPEDTDLRQAVALLESLYTDATYYRQFVENPRNLVSELKNLWNRKGLLNRLRQTRRDLILLTHPTMMNATTFEVLPDSWRAGRSPGAVRVAAMCFQNAFFAYTEGDKKRSTGITEDHPFLTEYREQATALREQARALVASLHSGEVAGEGRRYPVEEQLIFERLVHVAHEKAQIEATPYQDAVKGWFQRWQVNRARRQALKEFARLHKRKFQINGASDEDLRSWQELHAKAMMGVMGMTPVYDDPQAPRLKEAVELMAQAHFTEFEHNPKVQAYVATLSDAPAFLDRMRAIFTAQAYLDITTQTHLVPQTSPAQPGLFQWLRNSYIVKKLPRWAKCPFTVGVRFAEAATYTDGHHLGLRNWIRRKVPVVTDMRTALVRTLQYSLIFLSATWVFNYFFWCIDMPWYMHAASYFFGYPFVVGPRLFLQRAFRNIGVPPTEGWLGRMAYAFIYSWSTYFGYPLTQLFEPEARAWLGGGAPPSPGHQTTDASCAVEISNSV